jgi:hypothetical protein
MPCCTESRDGRRFAFVDLEGETSNILFLELPTTSPGKRESVPDISETCRSSISRVDDRDSGRTGESVLAFIELDLFGDGKKLTLFSDLISGC